jgi:hypothetical protein
VNDNPTGREKPDGNRYVKDAEDRFFFDGASGIYKPKTYQSENKSSEQTKNSNQFRVTTAISALTLLAVTIYAYYAALQWCEMKKAADASAKASQTAACALEENRRQFKDTLIQMQGQTTAQNDSASASWAAANAMKAQVVAANQANVVAQQSAEGQFREMRRQTEASERPWLSVEVAPNSGLTFPYPSAPAYSISVSIKNIGKSIAKDVQVSAKLIAMPPGRPFALDAANNQMALCNNPKVAPFGTFDLFPTDQPTVETLSMSAEASAVNALSAKYVGDKPRAFIGLYVVGCVSYHSSFGTELRQTRFGRRLFGGPIMAPGGTTVLILPNGTPLLSGFEVGVDVPQAKIGLIREFLALNDAY